MEQRGLGKRFERVRSTYSWWGRSGLYNVGTAMTLLGQEAMIRRVAVTSLKLHPGDHVVDIACGTGRNHPYLVEAVGAEGAVLGVDINCEMLERAREQAVARGWKNITLHQADAVEMNLLAGSFDGVICTLGFSVMPHYREAIRRSLSLLRGNGMMVVCDASPFQGLFSILNWLVVPLYQRIACWNPGNDVLGALEVCAARVDVRWFNGRSVFVAAGKPHV